jgi:hypothetical protein
MNGEIVCLDQKGRCQFSDLLFRRGEPCFVAFDVLQSNGKESRREPLTDRKYELRRVIGTGLGPMTYATTSKALEVRCSRKLANWTLRALLLKRSERLTTLSRLRGSRFGTATIPSGKGDNSYLRENVSVNPL